MSASTRVTEPDTLPGLLARQVELNPDAVALRQKHLGIWQSFTWKHYLRRVRNFALGLEQLGLMRGESVAIIGDNRCEWVIAELSAQLVGGAAMGIYQDSVGEEVLGLMLAGDSTIAVAEDQEQVDKLLEVRDQIGTLRHVIYRDPRGIRGYGSSPLLSFAEVEELGAGVAESRNAFRECLHRLSGEDVAVLATTSGTTGMPKLAMLTHANLTWMARAFLGINPIEPSDEFVSFLPLPWIGEQMIAVACGLTAGFVLNFPEEPETVQQDLVEIGPQVIFSPPRIWENLVSGVQVRVQDASPLKRRIYDWAMKIGYEAADVRLAGKPLPRSLGVRYRLADLICFTWIKDKLGLRRVRHAYTGGAALGPDMFRFFHALGVNLKQLYGQTEVSGISAMHRDGDIKFQTVGRLVPGVEICFAKDGEILVRSPSVFSGYYKNPAATAETLVNGWLHSGDAGFFDEEGHLIVIDRVKDVMTLADGTQFSPQFIENKLKFNPYVQEAVVFGGDGSFVTAIVSIDQANTGTWAEKQQIPYTTFTDLAQKDETYRLISEQVERTNHNLPKAARIQRFLLLHKELDADDAELTRTRKVRRRHVEERYRNLLDALYGDASSVGVDTTVTYQDGRKARIRTQLRIERVEPQEATLSAMGSTRASVNRTE